MASLVSNALKKCFTIKKVSFQNATFKLTHRHIVFSDGHKHRLRGRNANRHEHGIFLFTAHDKGRIGRKETHMRMNSIRYGLSVGLCLVISMSGIAAGTIHYYIVMREREADFSEYKSA